MAIIARTVKPELKVKFINETTAKKEFEAGLVDQGFSFEESAKGNRCYSHARINYIFIVCFYDYYEIRCFVPTKEYNVVKKQYKGRIEGLELLYH